MGISISIILVAAGAILAFAVGENVSGVDLNAIGWILLLVGAAGVLLSMVFWSSWAGPGYFSRRRTTYVDEGPGGPGYY